MSEFIVSDLKVRLDKFLTGQVPERSRSAIQRDIMEGRAIVNGVPVTETSATVRVGDRVKYDPALEQEPLQPQHVPLDVLYNNHGLLVIDKPAGLAVHPGAGFKGHSLASALLYHFSDIKLVGEEGRPGIVHRLDKDTSGLILVARTQAMYEYLKDAFVERKIRKEYIALVVGSVQNSHGFIEVPIGKSKSVFRKYTTQDMVVPKESLTEYTVLEHLTSGLDEYTLCKVKLHTGRTHQIRVHFASLGHPLLGDTLYGGKADAKKASAVGLLRQFLHAARVEVRLPDGAWIEAESPLPADLKAVLEQLHSKKVSQL